MHLDAVITSSVLHLALGQGDDAFGSSIAWHFYPLEWWPLGAVQGLTSLLNRRRQFSIIYNENLVYKKLRSHEIFLENSIYFHSLHTYVWWRSYAGNAWIDKTANRTIGNRYGINSGPYCYYWRPTRWFFKRSILQQTWLTIQSYTNIINIDYLCECIQPSDF